MKRTLATATLVFCAARGAAFAAVPAPGAPAGSTETVKATVDTLYDGGRFRDPFRPLTGPGAGTAVSVSAAYNPEDFSIHSLNVKGILKDGSGAYAVLVQARTGVSFILKNGQLFDYKNKRVPGVSGTVSPRQKTVTLTTPDKDIQTLRLGENEDDEQKKAQ